LLTAADIVANEGFQPIIEIMIPLVTTKEELTLARSWVEDAIVQHARLPRTTAGNKAGKVRKISRPKVTIGTMIETPRAALVANELAEVSDFFSFGTNDLTQMTFGFSRDDVESRLMPQYLAAGLLKRNPFESIDAVGVGELVRMAAKRGRKTQRSLKLGVCGEHGGDPDSIAVLRLVFAVSYSHSPTCVRASDHRGKLNRFQIGVGSTPERSWQFQHVQFDSSR